MATKKKKTPKLVRAAVGEIMYDETLGRQSFAELAPLRAALGANVPPAPRLDTTRVAVLVIGIAQHNANPEVRSRFRNIEMELPAETVDRLGPAGWALWYAAVERGTHAAVTSEAMLPAALVEEGVGLRARMLKVTEYHLGDRDDLAAKIAHLASGSGYFDLAIDLGQFAALYEENEAELREDKKRYRPTDARDARRIAGTMVRLLGEQTESAWDDAHNRAYGVVDSLYADIRPFGHAMFRREDPERLYPTLYSVRAAPRRKKNEVPPGTDLLGGDEEGDDGES